MNRKLLAALFMLSTTVAQAQTEEVPGDLSKFSKAINQQIALVETDGTVREGIVVAAGRDSVTMRFASGTRSFTSGQIASAERLKDGSGDGALKGAVFGALLTLLTMDGYSAAGANRASVFAWSVAVYSGFGYLFDATQTHREPIYRSSAGAAAPSLKLTFRF